MNQSQNIGTIPPELEYLNRAARWLDTQYRIPGTKVRFGFDVLLGMIPGVGDAVSLLFSGVLVLVMVRHGTSLLLLFRMLFNILLDGFLGSSPSLAMCLTYSTKQIVET